MYEQMNEQINEWINKITYNVGQNEWIHKRQSMNE